MKNSDQRKIGSLLSYVQMFIGFVISIIYTPIMLNLLGQSEYGLYNTVSSAISMLSILNLGLNSGYIRYFSIYMKKKDMESIWKLNGLFLLVFVLIGIIALICGMLLSFNLKYFFSNGLTLKEYETAKTLVLLLTINLAISFPMSVFWHIVTANEKFIFAKGISIIKNVLNPLITLPLLLIGFRSIAMVVVTLSLSIIADCFCIFYVLKKLNNHFVFKGFEKGIFRSLIAYTSFIAINLVVDQVNWNVDKVIIGRYMGTEMVAIYSLGYMLFQYYMLFSTSISSVFTSKIHRIVEECKDVPLKCKERLSALFIKVGRIQYILLGLIASGLVFFGDEFITIYWAGSEYIDSYYVTLLLILPATIPFIQNIGIEIQRAQNKHMFRSVSYTIMAILNVFISIFLCQIYGAVGSAAGTAVVLIIANGIVMNIYYHRYCNINIIKFWTNILQVSRGLFIPFVCGTIINNIVDLTNIYLFIIAIVLYTIIYIISIWVLGMNDDEKSLVNIPLKILRNKYKEFF